MLRDTSFLPLSKSFFFAPAAQTASPQAITDIVYSSKILPLKIKWEKSVSGEIEGAFQGKSEKFFLLQKNQVLAFNSQGEKIGSFAVSNPATVGEGKDGVYVVSGLTLKKFDFWGNSLWEKKFPEMSYDNWGTNYFSQPVEDKRGNVWIIHGQYVNWGEGCDCISKLHVFSPNQEEVKSYSLDTLSVVPILLDQKQNAYFADSQLLKFSPDFQVEKLQGTSYHLFLVKDEPYATIGERLYHLDFNKKEMPGPKDEILFWKEEKQPLQPVVSENGIVHFLLRNKITGKGFYVRLKPDAPPHQKVLERREIPFSIESGDEWRYRPYLTPNGTLYFWGEKQWVKGKACFHVYAMTPNGTYQTILFESEPLGFFSGKGEEVIIPFNNGKIVCLEAQTLKDRLHDDIKEQRNQEILSALKGGNQW
jgi:hypothetical protein